MGFRPLHDWVLIRRSEPEEKTGGGIIIPDAARSKPAEGVVEAIGPGRYKEEKGKKEKKFIPTGLKPGQQVIFIDYMAKDVMLDGKEITLIREEDILGTIEGPGALAVKKPYDVEIKRDRPPMVQAKPEKARTKEEKPAEEKKEAKIGVGIKKTTKQRKDSTMKKPQKKAVKKAAAKKTVKKAATKKTAAKKTVKKTIAKKTVKKATAKKSVAKKTAAKKSAPRKAVAKKAVKKTAVKKTARKAKK